MACRVRPMSSSINLNPPTPNPKEPFKEILKGLDDQNQVPATFPSFKRYLWKKCNILPAINLPRHRDNPSQSPVVFGHCLQGKLRHQAGLCHLGVRLELVDSIRQKPSSRLHIIEIDATWWYIFQHVSMFQIAQRFYKLVWPPSSSQPQAVFGWHSAGTCQEYRKRYSNARPVQKHTEMRFFVHGRLWWKVMESWCFYRSILDSSSQNCWDRLQPCFEKPWVKRFFITVKADLAGRNPAEKGQT